MKKIILTTALLLLPALASANDENTFRGINWAENIKNLPNMVYRGKVGSEKDGKPVRKIYRREKDNRKIGLIKLREILYVFYEDQFYQGILFYDGWNNHRGMLGTLVSAYGKGEKVPDKERYTWVGWKDGKEHTLISLQYDEQVKRGAAQFMYYPIAIKVVKN